MELDSGKLQVEPPKKRGVAAPELFSGGENVTVEVESK